MTSLKLFIVPGVIAFAILFGIFWIYPAYTEVTTLQAQLATSQATLEKVSQMQENSGRLVADKASNASSMSLALAVLPQSGEGEYVLWLLSKTAQEAGVTIVDVTVSPGEAVSQSSTPVAQEDPNAMMMEDASATADPALSSVQTTQDELSLQTLSTDITAIGSYETIKEFLERLEMLPRIYSVASLGIEKEGGFDDLLNLSVSLTFSYAPLKPVNPGTISLIFEKESLNFESVARYRDASEKYQLEGVEASGRNNPFAL